MPEHSIHKVLENFFSKSRKSDWEKIARQEIQKKNPLESLSWCGKDEILFLPYYDAEDVAGLQYLKGFNFAAAADDPAHQRSWSNLPLIIVSDVVRANGTALNHLSSGADGVFFDLRNLRMPDLSRLLRHIQWPHCTLAFQAGSHHEFSDALSGLIKNYANPGSVCGALFWESVPESINADFYFTSCKNLKSLGLTIPQASPVLEISDALVKGVRTFEAFSDGAPAADVFRSICFSLTADASMVETVAKLKALRMLWYQVAHAYGHDDFKFADLVIHARSARAADGLYGPHENMIKGTFSAMAAITGGCDMLSVECEEQPPVVTRQARNVSTILKEESFFNQVADPFAGAYAIDAITNALAEKAWTMFQGKIARL